MLIITDRFTKLTQAIALRRINALFVAETFPEHWIFKYGTPHEVVSGNGLQFAYTFLLDV